MTSICRPSASMPPSVRASHVLTPYAGAGGIWIDSKAKGICRLFMQYVAYPQIGKLLAAARFRRPEIFSSAAVRHYCRGRVFRLRPIYSLKAAVGF